MWGKHRHCSGSMAGWRSRKGIPRSAVTQSQKGIGNGARGAARQYPFLPNVPAAAGKGNAGHRWADQGTQKELSLPNIARDFFKRENFLLEGKKRGGWNRGYAALPSTHRKSTQDTNNSASRSRGEHTDVVSKGAVGMEIKMYILHQIEDAASCVINYVRCEPQWMRKEEKCRLNRRWGWDQVTVR